MTFSGKCLDSGRRGGGEGLQVEHVELAHITVQDAIGRLR